jgi:excisionase family DNA binding protein
MSIAELPDLSKPEEVAQALRITRRTVDKLTKSGQLPPPVRFGKSVLWRKQDLIEFLERQRKA